MNINTMYRFPPKQAGLTLIELMISVTIGLLLLVGLASVLFNSSRAQRELEKSGQVIENGRYAISLLTEDLRHAGFYGPYYELGDPLGALPDPCETTAADLENSLVQTIQGYAADYTDPDDPVEPDVSATTCDDLGLLVDDNLVEGSDILVIRRAAAVSVSPATTVNGMVYIQSNAAEKVVFLGDGAAPDTFNHELAYDNTSDPSITRQLIVHTYFVAPCSVGTGADGICQAGDDTIPTLKHLELTAEGGVTTIKITPLVEGIEYFLVEYGIDSIPVDINEVTGEPGDGIPDEYVSEPTAAQWPDVITTRVSILSRSLNPTDDHTDTKEYSLAGHDLGPFNDNYKRHVYSAEIRPINVSGRRENPE